MCLSVLDVDDLADEERPDHLQHQRGVDHLHAERIFEQRLDVLWPDDHEHRRQRWRQTGRYRYLTLCALGTALAPAWFASGILAGPLCCLYVLLSGGKGEAAPSRPVLRLILISLVPLLGSLFFLGVSLPRTGQRIMHLQHYQGKTALQAFNPFLGALTTARSLVEKVPRAPCRAAFTQRCF